MCWLSATRSVARTRPRGLGSLCRPSTCRVALGARVRARTHPPWGGGSGMHRTLAPSPRRRGKARGGRDSWWEPRVSCSAGSLQKAPGKRGPSSGHPALPWGCGHCPGCTCAVSVMVCECACTGGMQSCVSLSPCRPPHPRPERHALCRSARRGLKSLRVSGTPPRVASSLPRRGCSPAFVEDGFFFGFHSFMEKDSGKRKGEEQLKGETEPRGWALPLRRHLAPAVCPAGGGRAVWLGSYSALLTLAVFTSGHDAGSHVGGLGGVVTWAIPEEHGAWHSVRLGALCGPVTWGWSSTVRFKERSGLGAGRVQGCGEVLVALICTFQAALPRAQGPPQRVLSAPGGCVCEHTTWESVRVCMFECKLVCVRVNTRKNESEHAHVWVSVCLCVCEQLSESVCALEGMRTWHV